MEFNDSKIRILAIDGGGMLGTFASAALSHIEKEHNVSIKDTFDIVCGSSTGSIIAACLAAGKTTEEITAFYKNEGRSIFDYNITGSLMDKVRTAKQLLFNSKYNNKKLIKTINEAIGNITFEQAQESFKMCISTYDITKGVPRVFKTPHDPGIAYDRDMKLANAVVCSCSAPTMLPPYNLGESYFVDGGTWIQNPSIMGVVEAKEYFINPEDTDFNDFLILSVATATIQQKTGMKQPKSVLNWGADTFGVMLSGQAVSTDHMMRKMFNCEAPGIHDKDDERYARINCRQDQITDKMTGDNTDPAVLDRLEELGIESAKRSWEDNETLYKQIFGL